MRGDLREQSQAALVRILVPNGATWPGRTFLCMKQIDPHGRAHRFGTIKSDQAPFVIHLDNGDQPETFDTVEAIILAGWAVD